MRKIIVFITIVFTNSVFANVGVFTGFGHSIELIETEDVAMLSEEITITPGRGRFLFDGSVDGMDKVEYLCKFKLKNLKKVAVTIKAGFPLSIRHGYKEKTSILISRYNFIAQEDGKIYNVKFYPSDRKQKLENLFVWDMRFDPNEEIDLLITYSMPISMTLASTAKTNIGESKYEKEWYQFLEMCLLEYFGYITETGKSWSGPIRKAEFKVYIKGFEEYLRIRPFEEGMSRQNEEEMFENFPVLNPIFFRLTEPDIWKSDEKGFLRLTYENYVPEKNLIFFYYIISFPKNKSDANRLITRLSRDGFTSDDYEDLRDIFLEFNGEDTRNKRIRKFINSQKWYKKAKQNQIPVEIIKLVENKIRQAD